MTQDPSAHSDEDPASEAASGNLPAPDPGSRNAPVARQPLDQIARAMQVQAELLKGMHERQRMLEDAVKDNRRHELVINSAQALNESFQGLQRVQERLAEELEENRGSGRGRFVVLALALLALTATGGFLAWRIVDGADSIHASLKTALDPRGRDHELQATLASLEGRVHDVEAADRTAYRDEIDKLRKGLDAITVERDTLRRERDGAREELGAVKAALAGTQTDLGDSKQKQGSLEKENARLTAEALASQKTLVQLNELIATLKDARNSEAVTAKSAPAIADPPAPKPVAPPAVEQPAGKPASTPPEASSAAPPPRSEPVTATPPADADPGRAEAVVAGAGSEPLAAFPPSQLDALNALLKTHAGSDHYDLKKAERVGRQKLWNVVLDVRGADGTVTKTIEAESLSFGLSGDRLDIEFEGGTVTFRQGGAGKSTRAPFFNNRYVIVVLRVNGKGWLAANQPFVRVK